MDGASPIVHSLSQSAFVVAPAPAVPLDAGALGDEVGAGAVVGVVGLLVGAGEAPERESVL
jgi:hypothetical protein